MVDPTCNKKKQPQADVEKNPERVENAKFFLVQEAGAADMVIRELRDEYGPFSYESIRQDGVWVHNDYLENLIRDGRAREITPDEARQIIQKDFSLSKEEFRDLVIRKTKQKYNLKDK